MTEFERIKAMDVVEFALYLNTMQNKAVNDYEDGYFPKGAFANVAMLKREAAENPTPKTEEAGRTVTDAGSANRIAEAKQCLIDNGIEADEADIVLQALGYILLDMELYPVSETHNENWKHEGIGKALKAASEEKQPRVQAEPAGTGAAGRRMEHLGHYKENEELLMRAKEKAAQGKVDGLIERIKALEPRIRELIATGNACMECKIPLTGQAFGMQESYETNQFFTNSWSHLVGFAGNPHENSCVIEFLGINGGGACGVYDFRTDGVSVFSVNERNHRDMVTPSVGHMERFLNTFDQFETAFYAYVDKVIENQKKSVDKLIGAAQEKAAKQTGGEKQEVPKRER